MHRYPGSEVTWGKWHVKVKSEFLHAGLIHQFPYRTGHEQEMPTRCGKDSLLTRRPPPPSCEKPQALHPPGNP